MKKKGTFVLDKYSELNHEELKVFRRSLFQLTPRRLSLSSVLLKNTDGVPVSCLRLVTMSFPDSLGIFNTVITRLS